MLGRVSTTSPVLAHELTVHPYSALHFLLRIYLATHSLLHPCITLYSLLCLHFALYYYLAYAWPHTLCFIHTLLCMCCFVCVASPALCFIPITSHLLGHTLSASSIHYFVRVALYLLPCTRCFACGLARCTNPSRQWLPWGCHLKQTQQAVALSQKIPPNHRLSAFLPPILFFHPCQTVPYLYL